MQYPLKNWQSAKRGYNFGDKTFYSDHHLGVDIIVPEGTDILAPADSEIIFSKEGEQGGNTIWVAFQDKLYGYLVMRCMHLRKLTPKGKYQEGEVIGHTGNTGKFTQGPHLHLDISRGKVSIKDFNNFIDPEEFFIERTTSQNDDNMITYQKEGETEIYALVGGALVHISIPLELYEKEFRGATLIKLTAEEFAKYKISDSLQISLK